MKRFLIILVALLWCNVGFAIDWKDIKVYHKDENSISLTPSWVPSKQNKLAADHCAKHGKFAFASWNAEGNGVGGSRLYHCSKSELSKSPIDGSHISWTNYDPARTFSTNSSSGTSTNDKIAQSKQICKDLGFKTNTEKFADCALKMMSIQFEATNKVASASGGTTQEVIVTHRNDYDIWDALLDMSYILQDNNTSSSSSGSSGSRCVVNRTNSITGQTVMNCY